MLLSLSDSGRKTRVELYKFIHVLLEIQAIKESVNLCFCYVNVNISHLRYSILFFLDI